MASSAFKTRSSSQKHLEGVTYNEIEDFPNGRLPLEKSIIQRMLYITRPDRSGKQSLSVKQGAWILAQELQEHWHYCNIYTKTAVNIKTNIVTLYQEFIDNIQTREPKRTVKWKGKMAAYNERLNKELFDISTKDKNRINILQKEHDVTMEKREIDFLEDQQTKRIGYYDKFVDRI